MNNQKQTVSNIFKKYISSLIPKKQTNILFMMFNGIDEVLNYLDFKINNFKRERNILTAQELSSIRTIASNNGFEPKLKVPSRGYVKIQISSKIFNQYGFPIYLPPYSVFKNKTNNLEYYYESDRMLKIESSETIIPLVEGALKSQEFTSSSTNIYNIERFYLTSKNIADKSISVFVDNKKFKEVQSFSDNENINGNRQFIIKYSNDSNRPIILYIRGCLNNQSIKVLYRDTVGEYGNLSFTNNFETTEFIDSKSNNISYSDDDISIFNISGFNYGSDGSDINTLKSAIGYNHGSILLFDRLSYIDFLNKYSTILLQDIYLSDQHKSIKYIYISRKLFLDYRVEFVNNYKDIIKNKKYLFSKDELSELGNIIDNEEYALSSHNLFDSKVIKYAIQIKLEVNKQTKEIDNFNTFISYHKDNLTKLIYREFAEFLGNRHHSINFELLFNEYILKHKVSLDYVIFNSDNGIITGDNVIITHNDKLPILNGDFIITDSDNNSIQIFEDINWDLA